MILTISILSIVCYMIWIGLGKTILKDEFYNEKSLAGHSIWLSVASALAIHLILSIIVYFSCGIVYTYVDSKPIVKMSIERENVEEKFYVWEDSNGNFYFAINENNKIIPVPVNSNNIIIKPNEPAKYATYKAHINNPIWDGVTWTFTDDKRVVEKPDKEIAINVNLD